MKLFPKWLSWLDLILFGMAVTFVAIGLFGHRENMSNFIMLAIVTFLLIVIITAFWYVAELFNVYYDGTVIIKCWGKIAYKRIPYTKIEGASIECALQYPYQIPYRDEQGKIKAALILYQSDISFCSCVKSASCYHVRSSARLNVLCDDFLNIEHLKVLIDKTLISIYITEQILLLYKEDLSPLLEQYSTRFIVAYYDENEKTERKVSYEHFLLYNEKNI